MGKTNGDGIDPPVQLPPMDGGRDFDFFALLLCVETREPDGTTPISRPIPVGRPIYILRFSNERWGGVSSVMD
jgi:hypothetical protein